MAPSRWKDRKASCNWTLPREIKASVKDNRVSLVRDAETRSVKALHGLSRSLVHNMVQGVSEGFTKNLEIEGVGFKAAVQGSNLNLSLGKSHPILFPIPKEIKITVTDNTKIAIAGHRQESRRPGGRGHSPVLPAGALQGQRRALCGRSRSPQGRQDRSIVMALRDRKEIRHRIHTRIRKRVSGTAERPRLAVHFSGKHVYAQVIDDDAGKTLGLGGDDRRKGRGQIQSRAQIALRRKRSARQSRNVCSRRKSTRSSSIAAAFFITEK